MADKDTAAEAETRAKYLGGFYKPETIMRGVDERDPDYFSQLANLKLGLIRRYLTDTSATLDLCCATGNHLREVAGEGRLAVGLDYSMPFLKKALEDGPPAAARAAVFSCGDARRLPFGDGAFDLVYCFSSLYCLPEARLALAEMGRILKPGGVAIVELGNLWSLNTLVCRAHPETAAPFHLSVGQMRSQIQAAGLRIETHLSRQLLPLWGNKPRWLRLLLRPGWKRVMGKRIGGLSLDGWLCRIPAVRRLAFRQIFVCRAEKAPS